MREREGEGERGREVGKGREMGRKRETGSERKREGGREKREGGTERERATRAEQLVLYIEQPRDSYEWKYLHISFVFIPSRVITSGPPSRLSGEHWLKDVT